MIAIEKDVPFIRPEPPDTSLPPDWPMAELKVGESFLTGKIRQLDMIWHQRNWSSIACDLHKNGFKTFRFQDVEKEGHLANYRVWRIS